MSAMTRVITEHILLTNNLKDYCKYKRIPTLTKNLTTFLGGFCQRNICTESVKPTAVTL